ncbi:MAG: aminotransferase class I/II-fold pyridoxal phosphate-dependent enzyme [Myxococcales bacterium]|nr:aminotransferase class I/II-fold pyridoxal phosphate-dependent enzyme [Myxococcales bacterium]
MTRTPLDPDGPTLRARLRDVADRLVPWLERMRTEPVARLDGGRKAALALGSDWPEEGTPWRRLLALLDRALATSLHTTSPGYLAYVPGGGLPDAAVAQLYADLVNRFTTLWMPAPAFVRMEIDVIRWIAAMVGFGPQAGGLLLSGGSMANLVAIHTARVARLPEDFLEGVILVGEQTHHSVGKAARIAGFPTRALEVVPSDERFRMSPDALASAVTRLREEGRRPFLVVASAGTTAVGAVDDLLALAEICAREGLWLHVDGAYGGFFALTERGRAVLAGIERADSVTLDPHKGLFLPYGTGALVVARRSDLRAAHASHGSYLPPPSEDDDAWDLADLGPELSRDARGLRVWLPLRLHGFGAFRSALSDKLELARVAADAVRVMPAVRLVSEPVLSLFAFRWEGPGDDLDRANRRWLADTNQRGRVFLTGATVPDPRDGRPIFVLRVCVLGLRTDRATIDALIADLGETLPG